MSTHKTGLTIRGQWFGTWRTAKGSGFCIDFDRSDPNSSGATSLKGKVPGMNAEQSAQVKFVANKYAATTSKVDAAASAIFVWKTQHTARFDDYYAKLLKHKAVSLKVRQRLAEITAEAKLHGPYKVALHIGSGYVGQKIAGTVTVRTSKGKVVPGAAVAVTVNANGVFTKRAKLTDKHGHLAFTERVARPGAVRNTAVLTMPSHTGAWISHPTAGHQRLVLGGSAKVRASATASSQKSASGPTLSSSCSADCKGIAPVVVTMTDACGAARMKEMVYSNGKLLSNGSFFVPGCKTVTKTFDLPDAAVVTTKYCYVNSAGACTGAVIATKGSLTVICPPWVEYSYEGTCPCSTGKNLTYQVWAPATSVRSYQATLTESGTRGTHTQTLTLVNGTKQAFAPVRFATGDRVRLSFTVLDKTYQLDDMSQGAL